MAVSKKTPYIANLTIYRILWFVYYLKKWFFSSPSLVYYASLQKAT